MRVLESQTLVQTQGWIPERNFDKEQILQWGQSGEWEYEDRDPEQHYQVRGGGGEGLLLHHQGGGVHVEGPKAREFKTMRQRGHPHCTVHWRGWRGQPWHWVIWLLDQRGVIKQLSKEGLWTAEERDEGSLGGILAKSPWGAWVFKSSFWGVFSQKWLYFHFFRHCSFGICDNLHFHFLWRLAQIIPVVVSTWSGPYGRNMLCRRENKLLSWEILGLCLKRGQRK